MSDALLFLVSFLGLLAVSHALCMLFAWGFLIPRDEWPAFKRGYLDGVARPWSALAKIWRAGR